MKKGPTPRVAVYRRTDRPIASQDAVRKLRQMEKMHRDVEAKNNSLQQKLLRLKKQKAKRKVHTYAASKVKKHYEVASKWKTKRYFQRMKAREDEKIRRGGVFRSPIYRPGHSTFLPSHGKGKGPGVPRTGPREASVKFSNFSREPRFGWQREKERIPGPSDYNPNYGNRMEQL